MKNKYDALMLGGGGHARVLLDTCLKHKSISIIDRSISKGEMVLNAKVIGTEDILSGSDISFSELFIGIGFHPKNNERSTAFTRLKALGFNISSALSSDSYVSNEASIGEGVHILTNAIIHTGAMVGDNSIINTKSSIDHDSIIGRNCHLAPGSTVCGNCFIGDNVYVGAGAVIINNIKIGSNCLIAAGVTVHKDLPSNTIFYGNK